MQIVKSFYVKGYTSPVIVITKPSNYYVIHALVGCGAYFAEGTFTDYEQCVNVAQQKANAYKN